MTDRSPSQLLRSAWLAAGLLALWLPVGAGADARAAAMPDAVADLSIEELANLQVTSVSKKPELLAQAAAAVFVITAADIRRSGAASLPEALRLAPNLQVAQVSSSGYAISARGLNGSNTSAPNKLLVLIDGRSVYAPLFSGVFWDAQDVLMEDIERIEVVSGPGGTLWGVNAVNGVINVITRGADATAGTLVALRGGTAGGDVSARYGARSGTVDWRIYAKRLEQQHTALADGARVNDARHQTQTGFRADWADGADRVTVHGDAYRGLAEQPEPGSVSVGGVGLALGSIATSGVSVTGRWQHTLDGGGSINLQASLERTLRSVPPTFREALTLADVQFMHSLASGGAHSVVWGANYRRSRDAVDNSEFIAFLPARRSQTWASLFAQDEITLAERWRATVGARAERNDYTGTELLPTARLTYRPGSNSTQMLWGAVSRTVRAPSRLDADAFIPGHPPYLLAGGPVVRAEVASVLELGYRGQPFDGLSYSVTVFHNQYDHLRTTEVDPTGTFLTFGNLMEGNARGLERWGSYQASRRWRLSAGLQALHETLRLKDGSNDEGGPGTAGKDPSHTLTLRSTFDVSDATELELAWRKVAGLANPQVPGYSALDARVQWTLKPGVELSLSGRNLNGAHAEYGDIATRTQSARTVALQLVWRQ